MTLTLEGLDKLIEHWYEGGRLSAEQMTAVLHLARQHLEPSPEGRALWECPACAFAFAAEHTNEDGSYSCPVCTESRYRALLEEAAVPVGNHHKVCWCIGCRATKLLESRLPQD